MEIAEGQISLRPETVRLHRLDPRRRSPPCIPSFPLSFSLFLLNANKHTQHIYTHTYINMGLSERKVKQKIGMSHTLFSSALFSVADRLEPFIRLGCLLLLLLLLSYSLCGLPILLACPPFLPQRITFTTPVRTGNDPRNLAWRQDTTSFGQQYLLKAGHTPNTSLGLNPSSGLVNPIAVARKLDNSGIGIGRARREGGVDGNGGIGGAGGGLEEVLKRLAAAANGDGGSGSSTSSSSTTGGGSKILGGFAKAVVDEVVDTVVVREAVEAMPVASGSKAPATAVKSNRMA